MLLQIATRQEVEQLFTTATEDLFADYQFFIQR